MTTLRPWSMPGSSLLLKRWCSSSDYFCLYIGVLFVTLSPNSNSSLVGFRLIFIFLNLSLLGLVLPFAFHCWTMLLILLASVLSLVVIVSRMNPPVCSNSAFPFCCSCSQKFKHSALVMSLSSFCFYFFDISFFSLLWLLFRFFGLTSFSFHCFDVIFVFIALTSFSVHCFDIIFVSLFWRHFRFIALTSFSFHCFDIFFVSLLCYHSLFSVFSSLSVFCFVLLFFSFFFTFVVFLFVDVSCHGY